MARQELGAELATWNGKRGPALCYGAETVTGDHDTGDRKLRTSTHVSQGSERYLHGSLVPPGLLPTSQAGLLQGHRQRPPSQPGSPYRASWDTLAIAFSCACSSACSKALGRAVTPGQTGAFGPHSL